MHTDVKVIQISILSKRTLLNNIPNAKSTVKANIISMPSKNTKLYQHMKYHIQSKLINSAELINWILNTEYIHFMCNNT